MNPDGNRSIILNSIASYKYIKQTYFLSMNSFSNLLPVYSGDKCLTKKSIFVLNPSKSVVVTR